MEFDLEHKTILDTLENSIEAKEFINFLVEEQNRHLEVLAHSKARAKLWNSEAIRQQEELDKLETRVKEVRETWGL